MTHRFKKHKTILSALSIAVALAVMSPLQANANSSVRNEMNKMFGSMSNVTRPGAYETSRRGVISGGSVVVRNRIMNTNIASFQPPSFNAGCGGIDMFGGSFSFINKEQFVQLARSIASNAAAYAFSIAVKTMAPSVADEIDKFQNIIQKLNQMFSNSCQLAQGLVNDGISAVEFKRDIKGATNKSFKEGWGDVFESFTSHSGSGPREDLSPQAMEEMSGNIVWKALRERQVSNWYTYGGDNLNSAIMTLTGTAIIGRQKQASDNQGESAPYLTVPSGLTSGAIRFETLVKGGDIQVYSCGSDVTHCLTVNTDTATLPRHTIVGFEELIKNNLTGVDGNSGILGKIQSGQNLTVQERNFLNALPHGMAGMIFRLARLSDETVRSFVVKAAEPIGRDMAFELLMSFVNSAITASASLKGDIYAKEGEKVLTNTKRELTEQYKIMVQKGKSTADIMTQYNEVMQATAKMGATPDFFVPGITPTSSGQN